ANADRLTAGQTLYVPTIPATVVKPQPLETGDQACLYETPIPGATSASIQTVNVKPATLVNGNYQVAASSVTLIASGVQNAVKVRVFLSLVFGMTLIGEANVVNGQAQLAWQLPNSFTAGTIATKAIGANGSVWDGKPLSVVKPG